MSPEQKAIHDTRQSDYGPWRANMTGTSQQIAGMLTQMLSTGAAKIQNGAITLPPWAAPLFMTAVKSNRIASGHYKQDNADDAAIYAEFVMTMQREAADAKPDYGG